MPKVRKIQAKNAHATFDDEQFFGSKIKIIRKFLTAKQTIVHMCTATFYPTGDSDFIFTSNRDEAPGRATIPPQAYTEDGKSLFYPKDSVAGGTWIGSNKELQRMVCLLNGGLVPHIPTGNYARSRGLVVKEVLTSGSGLDDLPDEALDGVEPFTLIQIDGGVTPKLAQLIWTGEEAIRAVLPWQTRIWSSTLLYTKEVKAKREQWFESWLDRDAEQDALSLQDFHHQAGDGDPQNDLIMDRSFVKTKSISQVVRKGAQWQFDYEDLSTGLKTHDIL